MSVPIMSGRSGTSVFLTRREHRFLWFITQGYTPEQAGTLMKISGTASVGSRMRDKLGARTNAHAVALAYQREMVGPYEDCGSEHGYRSHTGRHEDACRACRRAHTEYVERNVGGPAYARHVQLTEAEHRLLKAWDSGRTTVQIRQNWGVSIKTVEGLSTALYRKLDVAHLPVQGRRYAALDEGRRRGWLRPVQPLTLVLPDKQAPVLTGLEVRTLAAFSGGASLAQAGEVLGIPRSQVSSRLARIYKKLDVVRVDVEGRRDAALLEARRRGYAV